MKRDFDLFCELEFWLVGSLVLGSMLFTRMLPIAIGAAAGFWIARFLLPRPYHPQRTPADPAVVLLLFTIVVTLWVTFDLSQTWIEVQRLLSGIALMYIIVYWARSRSRLNWLFLGASALGLLIALSAPVSVDWATTKIPLLPATLYESFLIVLPDRVHPNVLAGFLVLFSVLPATGILFAARYFRPASLLLLLFAGLGMAGMLILSQSRGAWIALAVALLCLVALRWRWGWIASLAILGSLLLSYQRFQDNSMIRIAFSSVLKSFEGRLDIWSRAIFMIQDFPVTGVGMGNFDEVMGLFYPLPTLNGLYVASHAHNLFLQIAIDLGLPGLFAWVAIFFIATAAAWKTYRTPDSTGFFPAFGAALLCSQAAMLAHGLTDSVTWGLVRPAPLVWALWGMALAGYLVSRSAPQKLKSEPVIA